MKNDNNAENLLRRCKSVTNAEEIAHEEKIIRSQQPDSPCHLPRDSLFSWSSGFSNFTGFANLAYFLLLLGGLRLCLENLLKYGIRVDPSQWYIVLANQDGVFPSYYPSLLVLILGTNLQALFVLFVEKRLAQSRGSLDGFLLPFLQRLEIFSLVVYILVPVVAMYLDPDDFSLLGSTVVCGTFSVVFLKLWSYIQVNSWCRRNYAANAKRRRRRRSYSRGDRAISRREERLEDLKTKKIVGYPDNLTVGDLYYFLFSPTLCYELNFPRTERIRKRFLCKRIAEVVIGFHVTLGLFQQWIVPSVKNSLIPFSNMDFIHASERMLKLAIPNHLLWLVFFYVYFHGLMNIAGEVLMFADRDFYGDWWNSPNIGYFWRTWNLPVHRWAVRGCFGGFEEDLKGRKVSDEPQRFGGGRPVRIFRILPCLENFVQSQRATPNSIMIGYTLVAAVLAFSLVSWSSNGHTIEKRQAVDWQDTKGMIDAITKMFNGELNFPQYNPENLPKSSFDCGAQQHDGYYADVELECQVSDCDVSAFQRSAREQLFTGLSSRPLTSNN
ncbi:unnamed protein product [Notodromas monacha]|uniref:diacylglycerol O-acyltransferase n=1 Tax=Notodromas monacha TaxID=399045 RepID=A0A7R9BIA0_9CRUS|nr:unnamed protein product [Notodromas monacha]CAG0914599.1 unnamed protein product [Notodromas monacha]